MRYFGREEADQGRDREVGLLACLLALVDDEVGTYVVGWQSEIGHA